MMHGQKNIKLIIVCSKDWPNVDLNGLITSKKYLSQNNQLPSQKQIRPIWKPSQVC